MQGVSSVFQITSRISYSLIGWGVRSWRGAGEDLSASSKISSQSLTTPYVIVDDSCIRSLYSMGLSSIAIHSLLKNLSSKSS